MGSVKINTFIAALTENEPSLVKKMFLIIKSGEKKTINNNIVSKHLTRYLDSLDKAKVKNLITLADEAYYNGESIISDDLYDSIVDYYTNKYKVSNPGGHTQTSVECTGNKIQLPVHLGSMTKVKPGSTDLVRFLKEYTNAKIIMEKLDGISLLIDGRGDTLKAYTRGNGTVGQNVTHLIPYIKSLASLEASLIDGMVRGELIVSRKDWTNISSTYANARNFVSGKVNRKHPEQVDFQYIQFVAYEYIKEEPIPMSSQLKTLNTIGFTVVRHKLFFPKAINTERLSTLLDDFRSTSSFEIDGIIVQDNGVHPRNTSGNPKYARAFKMDSACESALTTVIDVEWTPSKGGLIKPVVIVKPCKLAGVTIQRVTGNNASFMRERGIGKGAQVKIIRSGDVIPKIIEVVEKAKVNWPTGLVYTWDKNETDIILVNKSDNSEVKIKQLVHFVKTLGINFFGPGQISKAYEKGIDSCLKVCVLNKAKLLEVEGIKDKTASKIIGSIVQGCEGVKIHILAAATPYFEGLGTRRLELIFKSIPNVLSLSTSDAHSQIIAIKGFQSRMVNLFINGMGQFSQFLEEYKLTYTVDTTYNNETDVVVGGKLSGKAFVFTGFRDKDLEEKIVENGGRVEGKISQKNNVTHLVVKSLENTSQKILKAKEMGIEITTKEGLLEMF